MPEPANALPQSPGTKPKTSFAQHSRNKGVPPAQYTAWKDDPSDENYGALMKYLEPTISSGLKSYAQGDQSLKVRAQILATHAVRSWDPSKGAAIRTHVFNNLKGLQRFRNQRSSAVHVPESVRGDAVKVKQWARNFESEKGYEPSDIEVADALSMSLKRIRKARHGELPMSRGISESGDSTVTQARDPYTIWTDYVYHDLSPTNRKVFEWTTGYGGATVIPKREIARRLKISPAAVSMRVNTIQRRLQEVTE
jgi:hypothetical protein